ncbi:MAG TPA: methylenetetrahydrofolate reductase [NAD(P)H] [Burkholderiaceae bacterium]|nr:methylenetetrahydrofolate reductase [NAD(P)H] [Burkholderiaceae bacterium]
MTSNAHADDTNRSNGFRIELSFEFFPPNTEAGADKLRDVRARLAALSPDFFSVTYGAGGATRDKTLATVTAIADEGRVVAPHMSCIGATRESIAELLALYRERGIGRLVALRGDLPSGMVDTGDFRYASDLVEWIRRQTGDEFRIAVAAYPEVHPQARSAEADLRAFVIKMRAGADLAITQYFFNADAYFRFRDEAARAGVDAPIVPGIMPINNYVQLARFSDACGAEIPRWIRSRLAGYGDDIESIRGFGVEVVTDLCRRLLDGGAPGLHLYTLNQAEASERIIGALRGGRAAAQDS